MNLLPLWEGWDGACGVLDGAVVFWMGLWWNSFPLGKVGMGLTLGNSVGVAFSRRRYTQSDNTYQQISAHYPGAGNACG